MPKSRTSTKPRKTPKQGRSRATVDAIIEAAAYILTKVGWQGLSTNAIAERAGVNIGSLYQFFPNKEAVIAELQRRHAVATRADLSQALEQLPEQTSLRAMLTLTVELLIKEHRMAPAVHKAISEELPQTLRITEDDVGVPPARFMSALQPFLSHVPDPALATYMMGVAAHSIVHTVTIDRPELLDNPLLVEELVTMLENFLDRPPARAAALRKRPGAAQRSTS